MIMRTLRKNLRDLFDRSFDNNNNNNLTKYTLLIELNLFSSLSLSLFFFLKKNIINLKVYER